MCLSTRELARTIVLQGLAANFIALLRYKRRCSGYFAANLIRHRINNLPFTRRSVLGAKWRVVPTVTKPWLFQFRRSLSPN